MSNRRVREPRIETRCPNLPPHADRAGARQRCARVRRRRTRVPRPAGRHRRGRAWARPRRAGAAHRRAGARDDSLLEPVLSPAAGTGRRAAGEALRPFARIFLQQRSGSCRGVPEVCAALLVYARASPAAPRSSRMEGDFHGRTFGALSTTYDEHYRAPFAPLLPNVRFVPVNNPAALRGGGDRQDGGHHSRADSGRRRCPAAHTGIRRRGERGVPRSPGTLLIADEVQCGLGRTGQPFYFQKLGLKPDLVSVGKALAGGVPMGAALVSEEVAAALSFGDHGSTFGGNLLACRAALVCLDALNGGLIDHVQERRRAPGIEAARSEEEALGDRRDSRRRPDVGSRAQRRPEGRRRGRARSGHRQGVLVNRTAGNVIRLLPPLTITEARAGSSARVARRRFQ